MIWILLILISILVLIVVLLLNTLRFKPEQISTTAKVEHSIDLDQAIDRFSKLIQWKTISGNNDESFDFEQFQGFKDDLIQLYPTFHKNVECTYIEPRGILYRWKGQSSDQSVLFMSHYDVVPVEEEYWDVNPFSGIVKDGFLWGRGTLDTKGTLLGLLESAEYLMETGFTPLNDIYFAFSGDEETISVSAPNIVSYLEQQGIKPQMVLDEGGVVVENQFPGVKKRMALIGTAEKGGVNLTVAVKSKGGHSSAPPSKQSVSLMADIIKKVEKTPMSAAFVSPVTEMFDRVARHATFTYRLIFGNLWFFNPLLKIMFSKQGGQMNAMIRTTAAMTKLEGSKAFNVLPPIVTLGINLRIHPKDTVDSAIKHITNIINNDNIEIKCLEQREASSVSKVDTHTFELLEQSIYETFGDIIVSPYLMTGATDSRHYTKICENVYRFSGMFLTNEEISLIHSNNERIRLETIEENINFFINVINKF